MKGTRIAGSIFVLLRGWLAFNISASGSVARAATIPSVAGKITEFRLPSHDSRPEGITLGPDGNLWFVQVKRNQVGRITPAGQVTEFTLPHTKSGPLFITSGPDGNLWFTERRGNR